MKYQTTILFAAFILIGVYPAYGDSSHHRSAQVVQVEKSSRGTALGLSCGSIEFMPSNYKQLGASLGGYDGTIAPCIGGAITTNKNRDLYTGRIGTEDGKLGGAISGTWKFK